MANIGFSPSFHLHHTLHFQTAQATNLKAPPILCSRRQFQILPLFQKLQIKHDISWESTAGRGFSWNIIAIFFSKPWKMIICRLLQSWLALKGLRAFAFIVWFMRFWNLNLKVPITTIVVWIHCLRLLGQCWPRSDCSKRRSLIEVPTVCLCTWIAQ